MISPRSIVRTSVVALSVAILVGNTTSANAAFEVFTADSPASTVVDDGQLSVTSESSEVPALNGAVSDVRLNIIGRASRDSARSVHPNYRQANAKFARDMVGVHRSAYTGKYFTKSGDTFRKCVVARESNGYYKITGGGNLDGKPGGDYQGAYQMSPDLARGVTYMMTKESKKSRDGLLPDVRELRNKPANKWSRYWQDRAFFTILNWDGDFSGKKHWLSGGYRC